MKFMLMCCFEEDRWMKLPDSKCDAIMNDYGKFVRDHKQSATQPATLVFESTVIPDTCTD